MRMRALVILITLAVLPIPAEAQKNCVKGKPCGNTCIARDKVCHVGSGSARPAAPQPLVTATPASAETGLQFPDSIRWIGWREAKLYFRANCIPATTVPMSERVYFRTESQAKDSGFKRSKGDMDCS
jgi:hypothetical protein